ncbi:glycosyl hydrolase family 88 [Pseudopedobacter saltans DSM 12145]|uniref:Glycosyl hydrolase family 88 n=1 Tax=Pseudopedobacter saltans (strain ATCC 51119 / DSM 12145 / JCM 21818 / CCUG 39354 / LMG 10337 / NBRC 100064 / NCIMB 13643) TaxID=762903 RepID=F0S9R1_PSESL|nr:glycoside hydrolase family 88 protein [Pseudopedobacter saltans]ADY51417.1 glycosyl hydrolase family 88 [Pseudopedobacter saltans DSM 12145]
MKFNQNKLGGLVVFVGLALASCSTTVHTQKIVKQAKAQTDLMLTEIPKANNKNGTLVSPRTFEHGDLILVASRDWTSGFFPGNLWYLYELTKDEKLKKEAESFTAKIEQEKMNGTTHDMGFKIYCSFGNAYRLTGNQHYKDVIVQAAKTLITRFNPKVGALRSWDHNSDKWDFPVIIDNMLNLELLFEATRLTGDSIYYDIAVKHANTTMKNHFRPDYSTWHVISYNPKTGQVEKRNTHQGYSDDSAWARGQGWALYGYTMCYRYTKNPAYLAQAEHIAKFIFSNKNMPKDLIPYWDFDAPKIPNEPKDVSAAAVMSSALYELSTYSKKSDYLKLAKKMTETIATKYSSKEGTNKGFILDHSTGHYPKNSEIDVPINYADYYFLEGLVREERLKNHQAVVQ